MNYNFGITAVEQMICNDSRKHLLYGPLLRCVTKDQIDLEPERIIWILFFSYLDKKEFLERSDQRQFEKERDARLASSSRRWQLPVTLLILLE